MSLRDVAAADNKTILNDDVKGFAWPITVTNPAEVSASFKGFSNDVSDLIDPNTGQEVSGRQGSVALHIADLAALGLPEGISDPSKKPWIIKFDDINGNAITFKVTKSNPDRALGLVTCKMELYEK